MRSIVVASMNKEARDSLDTSSTAYLEEMQETLHKIEWSLAQATDSMASMRGVLHRLITYIAAGNEVALGPAEPRALRPVPIEEVRDALPSSPEEETTVAPVVETPVTPIDGDVELEETIATPSFKPSAYEHLVDKAEHRMGEEIESKIDTARVLSKVDERLRGLRIPHEGEEPSDTAEEA